MNCRISGRPLQEIIDFGMMPIANGFISNPLQEEFFYSMRVGFCPESRMVQLIETVPPGKMFHDNYHFISSTSQVMADHFRGLSGEIGRNIAGKADPLVVELGCNDGIMLRHLASRGTRHLGIEPSGNVAGLARQNGVEVITEFFNAATARAIVDRYGQADVIGGSNVFCHIENIGSVFEGINILLKEGGYLYFEDPYLLDIIQKSSFDQIYDEHVYYFSGMSVSCLAEKYGMGLFDMRHQDVHGGSMRYYLRKGTDGRISSEVERWIAEERRNKLDSIDGYREFKLRIDGICADLKQALREIKSQGNRVIGYGATSKSTTLLNYAGIGADLIDYVSDTTPGKIGKYTPGRHIPVKSYDAFQDDNVKHVLLFAWNHKKEILAKEASFRARGGKFITYFPKVVME